MNKSTKTLLNTIFFIMGFSGFLFIFYNDQYGTAITVFFPALLIALYGFMVFRGVASSYSFALVEKRIDTIYFMGYLYTFLSLVALLFKLKMLNPALPERSFVTLSLTYLAISASTSLAGILIRALVWNQYRLDHRGFMEEQYNSIKQFRVVLANE